MTAAAARHDGDGDGDWALSMNVCICIHRQHSPFLPVLRRQQKSRQSTHFSLSTDSNKRKKGKKRDCKCNKKFKCASQSCNCTRCRRTLCDCSLVHFTVIRRSDKSIKNYSHHHYSFFLFSRYLFWPFELSRLKFLLLSSISLTEQVLLTFLNLPISPQHNPELLDFRFSSPNFLFSSVSEFENLTYVKVEHTNRQTDGVFWFCRYLPIKCK